MLSPAGQAELAKAKAQQAPPVAGAGRAAVIGPDMSLLPEHLQPQYGGLYYPNMATYEADLAKWVDAAQGDAEITSRTDVARHALADLKKVLASPYGLQLQINANQHDLLQDKSRLAQQVGEAERKANYLAGAYETAGAAAERDRQEAWQKRQAEHRADMERRIGEIDQLNNEIANTKLDPGRWWKNRGAGRSILALIGLGLGAFAEGYSGGKLKNRAAEMIERAIDRDIDAQKSDMWNKRAGLKGKQTLYGLARQRFGDDKQAEMFARSQMWRQVAHMQRRVSRGLADDRKKAQLELMATTADANANHYELVTKQQAAQLHQQTIEAQRRAAAAAAAARARAKQQQSGWANASPEEKKLIIRGFGVLQPGIRPREAAALRTMAADTLTLKRNLGELVTLMSDKGNFVSPEKRARMKQLWSAVRLEKYKRHAGVVITEREERMIAPLFGGSDPTKLASWDKLYDQRKAIARYGQLTAQNMQQHMYINGLDPAATRAVRDPRTGKRSIQIRYYNTGQVYEPNAVQGYGALKQGRAPTR